MPQQISLQAGVLHYDSALLALCSYALSCLELIYMQIKTYHSLATRPEQIYLVLALFSFSAHLQPRSFELRQTGVCVGKEEKWESRCLFWRVDSLSLLSSVCLSSEESNPSQISTPETGGQRDGCGIKEGVKKKGGRPGRLLRWWGLGGVWSFFMFYCTPLSLLCFTLCCGCFLCVFNLLLLFPAPVSKKSSPAFFVFFKVIVLTFVQVRLLPLLLLEAVLSLNPQHEVPPLLQEVQ